MKNTNRTLKLSVPTNIVFIPLIRDFIGTVAKIAGFEEKASEKIGLAVEEAASNVITHAFSPGEEGSFDIIAEPTPLGIGIVIKEMGLPFDPSQIPDYDPGSLGEDSSGSGLGVYLMRKLMDEVSFHNLGKGGKETHLFKYLGAASPAPNAVETESEKAVADRVEGKIPHVVRRMEPAEAVEVSRCAYAAYNYTYVNEHIYFPERVKALHEAGKLVSFVAVAPDGELMGHAALELGDQEGIAECGVVFVKPAFRGQGCMNSLMEALIEEGKKRRLAGLFCWAVTSHPFSQKAFLKYAFKECGLLLSRVTPVEFKNMSVGEARRESLMHLFKYLVPPRGHRIFPPANHADMIKKIYQGLDAEPERLHGEKELPGEDAVLRITTDPFQCADINILTYGKNVVPEVKRNLKALCMDRIETIYLNLSLGDPLTARMAADFEDMGFFFSGVKPGPSGGDFLVLQYLNNLRFDYGRLKPASEMGQQLADYIKGLDPNLRSN